MKKIARSLTDEEYEDIFNSVLKQYCYTSEYEKDEDDAFETLIKDDQDFASQYVDAFVSGGQNDDKDTEIIKSGLDLPKLEQLSPDEKSENGESMDDIEKQTHKTKTTIDNKTNLQQSMTESLKYVPQDKAKDSAETCNKKILSKVPSKKHGLPVKKGKNIASTKKIVQSSQENHKIERKCGSSASSSVLSPKFASKNKTKLSKKQKMKERNIQETDDEHNTCQKAEQEWDEGVHSKEYIFTKFTEGSVVWARMAGYPWWPGMIEIDPDCETYFECRRDKLNIATGYHVVFFDDKVSRAWIRVDLLKPFQGEQCLGSTVVKGHNYKKQILAASDSAKDALCLSIKGRLNHYGFAVRFKGRWGYDSQECQASTSGSDISKKKKKNTSNKEYNDILQNLGITEEDAGEYLENAEEIIKNAESVLEQFFSSQSSKKSDSEEYSPDSSKKDTKKIKKKSIDQNNDTLLTDNVSGRIKKNKAENKVKSADGSFFSNKLDKNRIQEEKKKSSFNMPKICPKKPQFGIPKKKKPSTLGKAQKKGNTDKQAEVDINSEVDKEECLNDDIFTMEFSQINDMPNNEEGKISDETVCLDSKNDSFKAIETRNQTIEPCYDFTNQVINITDEERNKTLESQTCSSTINQQLEETGKLQKKIKNTIPLSKKTDLEIKFNGDENKSQYKEESISITSIENVTDGNINDHNEKINDNIDHKECSQSSNDFDFEKDCEMMAKILPIENTGEQMSTSINNAEDSDFDFEE